MVGQCEGAIDKPFLGKEKSREWATKAEDISKGVFERVSI